MFFTYPKISPLKRKKPLTGLSQGLFVAPIGFEPMTGYLEGSCSIQLSYGVKSSTMSGWQDSNLRPPGPKPGAIPGYATPRKNNLEIQKPKLLRSRC